jgi:nucleotide-binding universal stress UspA family protein
MFSTIVVGVDGREGGRDALALAERLARTFDGELIAVHAYPYDHYVSRGASADFDGVMREVAAETLTTELQRAGVTAEPIATADSSPGRSLHRVAELRDADLIVVGSAHRGRIGRVLAGDVTAGTLHGAPCPVLVAPRGSAQHGGDLQTIGVGYDGSHEAQAALELAHELGDIATGDIAFGDPARELAFEGNHLDLLVTGSRGYGPVRRLMLGSTSAKLVHEAPCPVLVLTRSAADERAQPDESSATVSA